MIALDAALRRLTVCQLTHESRGNGGGLRRGCGFASGLAAGGNWTPDGILQLEGEANFSCLGAHEAHPKTTLYGVVFQKLNGPLLTSGHDPRSTATSSRIPLAKLDRKDLLGKKMYDHQGNFLGKVVSVIKDDAGEIVSVQLRATVTREARVPANQVNIKPDGGTLTLAESNKGLQWNYIGPRNP